ncbi:rRNA pseudouridine synthase [bacterium]|nr:rRNA pseudouridine synthase [bacterium]
MKLRLQKFIAQAGVASRRKAEELISQGRVLVNGDVISQMGTLIDTKTDHIRVDGKLVLLKTEKRFVYALYKPKACVTTLDDPQGRDTIVKYFPKTNKRLFPIGRLDYDAEGLILLTNDGELAQNIAHPTKHIWKEYLVKIKGKIDKTEVNALTTGPLIDGKKRQPVKVRFLHFVNDKSWLSVSLQEGLKHHLKKMFATIGYPVLKIKRYRIGNIELMEMQPGEIRKLTAAEIEELLALTGCSK